MMDNQYIKLAATIAIPFFIGILCSYFVLKVKDITSPLASRVEACDRKLSEMQKDIEMHTKVINKMDEKMGEKLDKRDLEWIKESLNKLEGSMNDVKKLLNTLIIRSGNRKAPTTQ